MTELSKQIEAKRAELAELEDVAERERNQAYAAKLRAKAEILDGKAKTLRRRADRLESGEDALPPLRRSAPGPNDIVIEVPAGTSEATG